MSLLSLQNAVAKLLKILRIATSLYKKSAKFSDILADFCSEWMLFSTFMRNFAVVKLKNGSKDANEKSNKSGKCRSLWTQIGCSIYSLYAFQKGHGEFSKTGVPFLNVKHELCSLRAYAVIVCWYRELVDKCIGIFFLQILGQLQFYGHPSLIIAQVPDTFTKDSVYHRPDFVLSAPDSIEVSHNTRCLIPR